ncbi:MAG TPA: hypothetical protein VGO62_08750 [Myxococcota bacterium]|jgi:hypothetical protein
MLRLLALAIAVAALGSCFTEDTGDVALCCTCLNQKSPVNDGNAVDPTTNCLPDKTADNAGEVDQCNQEGADFIADPTGDHPIHVVDEVCTATTCQQECNGATLRGVKFEVEQQSLSQ